MGGSGKVSTANQIASLPVLVDQQRLGSLCEVNFLPSEELHSKNSVRHFGPENYHLSNILLQNSNSNLTFQ